MFYVNRSHLATPPEQAMHTPIESALLCRTRSSSQTSREVAVSADQTEPSTALRGPLSDARSTSRLRTAQPSFACRPVVSSYCDMELAIDIPCIALHCSHLLGRLLLSDIAMLYCVCTTLPAFISLLNWILLDYRFPSYSLTLNTLTLTF